MKIKVTDMAYEQVLQLPKQKHRLPGTPHIFFRTLLKLLSAGELKETGFTWEAIGMERLGKNEPALFLMNHSSFIDLKIAATILYPRPFHIVCTSDGFVGKAGLMHSIGCIPTNKFVTDTGLVRDMLHAFRKLGNSVLMYPEASYSFDGTATDLPESVGKSLKLFRVPVVMIRTYGALARDPLYNNLQKRNVRVSAQMEYLLSPEDIQNKTADELNEILRQQFAYDHFAWQKENNVAVTEPFRADGLNRVLYRCPVCNTEGSTLGKGIRLSCRHCNTDWTLTELGELVSERGSRFCHIPDWYQWERQCVREELLADSYRLDVPVDICMLVNTQSIYRVGSGMLHHDRDGFLLEGCGGKLTYLQPPWASYSLYADYYWYEIGDVICIGNAQVLYYCFPKDGRDVAAKTRLAAEELYKLTKQSKRR